MSKTFYKLSDSDFFQDWSNSSLITTANDWSGVPSIMGYRGDGLASSGKDARLVTGDSTVVNVNPDQANPNTYTTGGVTEFSKLADPTVALQGSGTAQAPNLVLYLDASSRQDLHFSVDLRDIDGSGDNAVQQIVVQYRVGDSGAWTNVPGGYVADASTGPSLANLVTHLELDLPAAVNNQSQVEIRVLTADAFGADEWIGVDNLKVTSKAMAPDTSPPELASTSPLDGAIGVGPNADLVLNFNELVTLGSGKITISDGAADVRVIDVADASQVSVSGQQLVINPTSALNIGTTYHVSVDAGAVLDKAGNAYGGTGSNPIDFSTVAALTHTYEIQGAGHRSPMEGALVITRGVVTAIDPSATAGGFWIQDQQGDGNDATSDALFVYAPGSSVHTGDLVQVYGTVTEFKGKSTNNLTITEVSNVQEISVLSSGNTVAPTVIGDGGRLPPTEVIDSDNFGVFNPSHDGIDFYESIEGMLVTAKNVQVIDDTYQQATYVVTDLGAHATGMNDRGGITHGATDVNPERIEIYGNGGIAAGADTASFETGDLLGDVTGVMSYYNGNYELIPIATPTVQSHLAISSETTALKGDTGHLTVGAYNMANMDPNDAQWKFDALGYDVAVSLGSPDILGVEEVQDSNGTGTGVLSADVTVAKLIDAIVAAGGPHYAWVSVDPTSENSTGGQANGNIRNVILYNPEHVSYVAGSVHLLSDTTPANGDSFANSRKPLVADFMFHGEEVTFVSIHNYSRLGSDELYGVDQPPYISGDARRTDQTTAVRDFVQQVLATKPDANVVVGGDFNGLQFETSLTQLETGGLTNLIWKLEATDRYTSTFEGNNEQIDHLLVSTNLYASAQFDDVHVNTNLPYDTSPTDHDPVLSRLLINHAPTTVADTSYGTDEDVGLLIDALHGVLANDSDINGDAMSVALVNGPAHGTLALRADGSFEYHADANYNGADSFTYVASDAFGGASSVTQVRLAIASVNDAPVAANDSASVAEDAEVTINVLGNDSDVDGDALSIVLADAHSALGATLVVDHGQVRYLADADAFDLLAAGKSVVDSFTYTADDGHGGRSAPVTVSITVNEAGDNQVVNGSNKSGTFTDTAGHDTVYNGGNGDDVAIGLDGSDSLHGGNGKDVLFGGAGADFLFGDNGTDILVGGAGFDTLTGGEGPDTFVITADSGKDKVLDFKPQVDTIVVGYAGTDSAADVSAFIKQTHVVDGFSFADVDLDGNGSMDAVAITGGALGGNTVLLSDWSVATLVGQGFLTADHHVRGNWLLAADGGGGVF
ncbi:Ig-like domain-containing protein [Massilia agilis]|uniref:Ig-like domain-containing protein n=1 Tax=Massilia agilis TaxID=1811226 RepID=A0ABT2DGR3_9BURK|nr:Ig-like domain-containing protein [Massilia agilis]MCS0810392.1 Ig-like domain-containing protein [Massilia agilis]